MASRCATRACKLASLAPIADGLVGKPGLGVMVGDELGRLSAIAANRSTRILAMLPSTRAAGPEQCRHRRRSLYQRVLERVVASGGTPRRA